MIQKDNKPIVIGTIISIVLFLVFMFLILTIIYPSISDIRNKQEDLKEKYHDYDILTKKAFDFNTFKALVNKYKEDKDFKDIFDKNFNNIFSKITINFYNDTLFNGKKFNEVDILSSDIEKYLKIKEKKLDSILVSDEYRNRISNISKSLPKYSQYLNLKGNGFLTDLSFISYIESILYKFNITTTSKIGIKNVLPIEKNSNIYYIPLELDIKTTKLDLLKFLQYIQESGKVSKFGNKLQIISENQLSEVENLDLNDYINKSGVQRINEDLISFIKETNQQNDIISGKIKLRFYVNGIGKDKIITYINKVIGNIKTEVLIDSNGEVKKDKHGNDIQKLVHYNYNNLLKLTKLFLSNKEINSNNFYKQKVLKISKYLNSKNLKNDIKQIKKGLAKSDNLNSIYQKVLKYKQIFSNFDLELQKIAKALQLDKTIKDENGKIIKKSIFPKNY